MAPINATALNGSKEFSPAKKSLPEVDTEGGSGNGNGTKGYSYETLLETANFLLSRTSIRPSIGVICGSGMGSYWKHGIYSFRLYVLFETDICKLHITDNNGKSKIETIVCRWYGQDSIILTVPKAIKDTPYNILRRLVWRTLYGSYCGSLAENITDAECIPYEEIPNFPVSTVEGHHGRLVFGRLDGVPVVAMQGRFHYYEGYPLWKCCLPVRVMKLIGVQTLIATNAAGGLNPSYKIGDLMIVKDHINMMGFAGNNPLHGPNDERFGPRFPPMNKAYNYQYRNIAKELAKELNIENIVREGVYTCLGGPNFETVAELNMLKMVGVDAVGMSTVHEVIIARHCDMKVFALSLITNECVTSYDQDDEANHEEVLDVGRMRQDILRKYVSRLVSKFAELEN